MADGKMFRKQRFVFSMIFLIVFVLLFVLVQMDKLDRNLNSIITTSMLAIFLGVESITLLKAKDYQFFWWSFVPFLLFLTMLVSKLLDYF